MTIEKTVFICEICNTQYTDETRATLCENRHPDPATFEIISWFFRDLGGLHAFARSEAERVPSGLLVRFGPEYASIARYKLERVGMKGL